MMTLRRTLVSGLVVCVSLATVLANLTPVTGDPRDVPACPVDCPCPTIIDCRKGNCPEECSLRRIAGPFDCCCTLLEFDCCQGKCTVYECRPPEAVPAPVDPVQPAVVPTRERVAPRCEGRVTILMGLSYRALHKCSVNGVCRYRYE